MKYVEAPKDYYKSDREYAVFLGGGITNCPDWQATVRDALQHDNVTLLNPRRVRFNVNDKQAAPEQIRWEHSMLKLADVVMFWFPEETLCPITLYELGAWSMTKKPLVVGCHPGYERKLDVEVQTSLVRPEIYVVDSLEAMVVQLRSVHRAQLALR